MLIACKIDEFIYVKLMLYNEFINERVKFSNILFFHRCIYRINISAGSNIDHIRVCAMIHSISSNSC